MIQDLLVFSAGVLLLVTGAEAVVRGGSGLGKALGISPLAIGLTVVAFGTSSPELVVSVLASTRGASDVAIGNAIGSNIFNILAILGPTALLTPLVVHEDVVRREVPVMILATLLFVFLVRDGDLKRGEGSVLLIAFALYTAAGYLLGRRAGVWRPPHSRTSPDGFTPVEPAAAGPRRFGRLGAYAALVLVGSGLLVFGGRLVIAGASSLALDIGASERVIALTLVAGGTSLPELATSLVAAVRRQTDIAVGNIVGSNVFNLFAVLGVAAALHPLSVAPEVLRLDLPVALLAAIATLPIVLTHSRISRWEGAFLTAGYPVYLVLLLAPR